VFHNAEKGPSPKKKFNLLGFGKTKLRHESIKATGHIVAKIEEPFRFVPQLKSANLGLKAFIDMIEEEKEYQNTMQKLLKFYSILGQDTEIIQNMIDVTTDLHEELPDIPDHAITSRVGALCQTYSAYFDSLDHVLKVKDDKVQANKKLAFELVQFDYASKQPFQRLLEYRFFLRTCLTCGQIVCGTKNCTVENCEVKKLATTTNTRATKSLTFCIEKFSLLFGIVDSFHSLSQFEDELDTSQCQYIGESLTQKNESKEFYVSLFDVAS
jgi:1,4-alpha-glucan branching enzyme